MIHRHWPCLNIALIVIALPVTAVAIPLRSARLTDVTAVGGGCVVGPTGVSVQFWDVEPGRSSILTIRNVTECAGGGTDPTLNVRINSSGSGNTDIVATRVAPGTYQFTYTLPANAACTLPIFYCTTPGSASTGYFVRRADGRGFQAHLRAATIGVGCTNPRQITGPGCGSTPALPSSWGRVKILYR
jgi:hypothetical protein